MENWLDIHTKVKAALVALGVIALGEVAAVAGDELSVTAAVRAFVIAAVPVLVAYLKSSTPEVTEVPVVALPEDTVNPDADGDDNVANA